ncbi:MAG: hypothetical protein ACI4IK_02085 [Eubacterium sp.]
MSKWYKKTGTDGDIAVASKIRLARNIDGTPFPCKMTNDQRKSVCKKIFAAVQNSKLAGEFALTEINSLRDYEKIALYEKGIISARLAKQEQYGAVMTTKDEDISIMLCEEDHIRLTARAAGLELKSLYGKIDAVDNVIIDSVKIAFDKKYGFLTSNPIHLGTGLKASVLLHLPAINSQHMIASLSSMVSKLGFSIKEAFGGNGDLFELSNEISLGITEENALDNLEAITRQIIRQEKLLRERAVSPDDFDDRLYRAVGTLKMARKLSAKELCSLLSVIRLGISQGAFDDNEAVSCQLINELLYTLGTASVMADAGEQLTADEADKLRAGYIREKLAQQE